MVVWQGEEGNRAAESGEEALVGCALGGREGRGGWLGESEGCDDAVAAVVPALGGDVGEGADGAVDTVCTDEEAGRDALGWLCFRGGACGLDGDDGPG